jgi:hypothetical protein
MDGDIIRNFGGACASAWQNNGYVQIRHGVSSKLSIKMRHLASAGDIPAVFMVQGMANFKFHHTTRIISFYFFETIRTAMFFVDRQLNLRLAMQWIPTL